MGTFSPSIRQRLRYTGSRTRGLTLLEVLVTIGVAGLLLSLVLPVLGKSKLQAHLAVSLSNIRQCGTGVISYAHENADKPPVMFPPREAYIPPDSPDLYEGRGIKTSGLWWDHQAMWNVLLSPPPPPGSCWAPGHKGDFTWVIDGSPTAVVPDYFLSLSLYAEPQYWDRFTQRGAAQWRVQRLTDIRYPSDKGLMWQFEIYGLPGSNASDPGAPGSNAYGATYTMSLRKPFSSVLWADFSATNTDFTLLHPGEPNFYYYHPWGPTYFSPGDPISGTRLGVWGRDRGGAATPTSTGTSITPR